MFRSSKGDIGFIAFLLFLILCIFLIVRPVKADDIPKPQPVFPPTSYTIVLTDREASQLVTIFHSAEMAQNRWQPLYDAITHQMGVENDAASKAFNDWQTEENKRTAPKK